MSSAAESKIGILALQGDFELHLQALQNLGQTGRLVKTADDLAQIDRLIIPGGESTTISRLLVIYGLRESLLEFGRTHPVWGTCAGLILLARMAGDDRVKPLGLIDIDVERNAYGRQIHSFSDFGKINLNGHSEDFKMVFIRAPKIIRAGTGVEILGKYGDEIVFARQGRILVTAFHPELSGSTRIHAYFLSL